MRLIDADALIVTDEYCKKTTCRKCTNNIINCEELKDFIDNAPTVDAVEVVRCIDCRFFDHGYCWFLDSEMSEDGYCSMAKKDGDEE